MAAPDIVNVTSIFGKTAVAQVTTTNASLLLNAVSSNKVLKVNTIIVANVDGTNDASVDVAIRRSGIDYHIAFQVVVPANATIVVVSKDNSIYLEEGDDIRITANASGDLEAICSYEEIDDA